VANRAAAGRPTSNPHQEFMPRSDRPPTWLFLCGGLSWADKIIEEPRRPLRPMGFGAEIKSRTGAPHRRARWR